MSIGAQPSDRQWPYGMSNLGPAMQPPAELPNIVPLEFLLEYEPNGAGGFREVEKVRYTKRGTQNATVIEEKVARLRKQTLAGGMNPAWVVLKPYYDAWKEGRDAPVNGTPLDAWPGSTRDLVKVLSQYNVRSVEDLAAITDADMQRMTVPNIRTIRDRARAFAEAAKSTAPFAEQLAQKEERIADLSRQIDDLKQLVTSLADKQGIDAVDDPPGAGAPPSDPPPPPAGRGRRASA